MKKQDLFEIRLLTLPASGQAFILHLIVITPNLTLLVVKRCLVQQQDATSIMTTKLYHKILIWGRCVVYKRAVSIMILWICVLFSVTDVALLLWRHFSLISSVSFGSLWVTLHSSRVLEAFLQMLGKVHFSKIRQKDCLAKLHSGKLNMFMLSWSISSPHMWCFF